MARGVLTVMLACGLLTQSAPHAHTHPDGAPSDHALRPHLHIGAGCHSGHPHHPDADTREAGEAVATMPAGPGSVAITDDSDDDHDDDALYLTPDALGAAIGRATGTLPHPLVESGLGPLACTAEHVRPGSTRVRRPHPPPLAATPGCPRYVRHLALLL